MRPRPSPSTSPSPQAPADDDGLSGPGRGRRISKLTPGQLDDHQRALYDSIAHGPRARRPQAFALTDDAGGLEGPFNAMLLSPTVGTALQSVGAALRYESALSDRAREAAILAVAHHWDSAFEQHAHEAVGRTVGLTRAELVALREGDVHVFTDPVEQCVLRVVTALVVTHDLGDEEFASAEQVLGAPLLFELTTLVGYYAMLALQLRVFGVAEPS